MSIIHEPVIDFEIITERVRDLFESISVDQGINQD
jgi:hypothetical protein